MKHFLSCRKTSYSKLLKIVVLWVYLNQGLTRYQRVTLPPELYTHHQKTIDSFTYANIQEIAVCLLNILKMQMYNDCSCGARESNPLSRGLWDQDGLYIRSTRPQVPHVGLEPTPYKFRICSSTTEVMGRQRVLRDYPQLINYSIIWFHCSSVSSLTTMPFSSNGVYWFPFSSTRINHS